MKRSVGTIIAAGILVACGSDIAEGAGDMLVDAGHFLSDASIDDASAQSDASALPIVKSETHETRCDLTDVEVVTTRNSPTVEPTTSRRTSFFSVLNVATADITGVDVLVCRAQAFDPCTQPNASCEGSTMPRPPLTRCVTTTAEIGDGFVRANCNVLRGVGETARFTIRR